MDEWMHTNLEPKVKQKILTIGHVLLRQGIVSPHKILHKERCTKNSFGKKKIQSFNNGLRTKSELFKSQILFQKFTGNATVLLKGCSPLPRFETQP